MKEIYQPKVPYQIKTYLRVYNFQVLLSQPSGAPVMIAVYYEALCPDSRFFVTKQLQTTFQRAPSLIAIEYIPYGKATTSTNPDGSLQFECQHGKAECDANIVHACTIEAISDPTIRLEAIACMITNNANALDALNRVMNFIHVFLLFLILSTKYFIFYFFQLILI